ncbi:uncharacterized protein CDAR_532701 [Caerostris darwini]|uniref:Uncharacterized protein n=1 Tax=Caerostris darwini TaxID=1538125 RepID=A0AAV4VXP6_9ARAC|nr:uncharacterized protein CDAR_532701 [Caerostris darwini]
MFAKLKTNPQTAQESNPITQYFDIGKQVASAGPELVWKIHEAVRKSDKRIQLWYLTPLPEGSNPSPTFQIKWEVYPAYAFNASNIDTHTLYPLPSLLAGF